MSESLPILDLHSGLPGQGDPEAAKKKLRRLLEILAPLTEEGVLVAFSGGMDSAFLLWAARKAREAAGKGRVVALTTTSASTPNRDRLDAEALTRDLDIPHVWRESREMELPEYARNDRERCYHCKVELFRIAEEVAGKEGLGWILYGYNASDRGDVRPGHRAAEEAGALSPLADADLGKGDIRFLMKEVGLPLSEKPASPCLSSRIMTGIPVTPERLAHVEAMEEILRKAGASTVRVRVCREDGGSHFFRVEAGEEDFDTVMACRKELHEAGLAQGYRWVTLDLGGYRTGGGVT